MKTSDITKILFSAGLALFASSAMGEPIYKFEGKSYTRDQLSPSVRQALYEAELERYQNATHFIEEDILERHLAAESKKKGVKVEQLREQLVATKPPTEKEMRAWYDANKDRIPYPYDKIKKEVSRMLASEKAQEKRGKVVDKLKKKGGFKLMLKEPQAPAFEINSAGFPSKGSKDAKVTLVEFADYQCPHCKRASGMVRNLMKKYSSKVKLVFLDFPINSSGVSRKVAEGGVCAAKQKKYWEYHYMAFDKQKELSHTSPEAFAKALKLDLGKFKKCLKSPEAKDKVAQAEKEGQRVGVRGTPTFYLNGRKVSIADEKQFAEEIESALAGKKS